MLSVIITSYKEERSIGRALEAFVTELLGENIRDFEIIQVSPDKETLSAGKAKAKQLALGEKQFIQITDPRKGKPHALNLALNQARGEIVIMSDGDVKIERGAIKEILKPLNTPEIHATTGQPVPTNQRSDFMGYLAHLLTAAADNKRKSIFHNQIDTYYTAQGNYFPMSGYLLAFKNSGYKYDEKYIDDAFISLMIVKNGYNLAYSPQAKVSVKFPTTLKDYIIQRRRNIHGTQKIHKDPRFKEINDQRSLSKELKYILFPLKFATNMKEFLFSLLLYPLRVVTWFIALIPQRDKEHNIWKIAKSTKS